MHPGRRPSGHKTLAVAVFCLAASFLAAPVPAEARAVSAGQGPQQVMDIPPADPDYSTSISILGAGQTGMLMEQASLPGDWWTDYSTGATTQVPTLPATVSSMQSMGGDRSALWGTDGTLHVGTPALGDWQDLTVPAGATGLADASASTVMFTGPGGLSLYRYGTSGSPVELPVTGLPAGVQQSDLDWWSGDDQAALVSWNSGSGGWGLIDLTDGSFHGLPGALDASAPIPDISGDELFA